MSESHRAELLNKIDELNRREQSIRQMANDMKILSEQVRALEPLPEAGNKWSAVKNKIADRLAKDVIQLLADADVEASRIKDMRSRL